MTHNNASRQVKKDTTGFLAERVVDKNSPQGLGLQICRNLIGKAPNSFDSENMSNSNYKFATKRASQLPTFEQRSTSSNLFKPAL